MKKIIVVLFCFYALVSVAQVKIKHTHKRQAPAASLTHNEFNPDSVDLSQDKSADSVTQAVDPLLSERLQLQKQYDKASNDYYVWNCAYKRNIFKFQYISGIIIFIVVLIVVFTGLVFSAWQFYITMSQLPKKNTGKQEAATNIELSASGLKVTSSVLGVIIIALSLAFFYLYLAYVYPISAVSLEKKPEVVISAKK